jgi:hypothetical protein
MDRTALIEKLGDKIAETGSRNRTGGTGQQERTIKTGQWWQDSHGRKDTTGRLEKTSQDSWDRKIKTAQPWQDSQERTSRTGQGQLGQNDQHRTNSARQP